MWLKRLPHQNEGNFRCAWIVPNKRQPNGRRLNGRGQLSDWSVKSIRWHLSNASFSINHSIIMSDYYSRKLGLREQVPEAQSPKKFTKMKTASEEEVYGAVNITPNKHVEFQVRSFDAETESTTWCIADADHIVSQLEREINGIPFNEQMRFKKELSTCLIKFGVWWQAISVQELRKPTEQRVMHFGFPKMRLVSHISELIWLIGYGDHCTTDISEQLHIGNVPEAYWSTKKVNCVRQMLKHNDPSTSLDYMDKTLSYLALQGWYDIDSAEVFNPLSTADKWGNTPTAHLLHLQHYQNKASFRPVSPQVHHSRETHIHRVCRSIKLSSVRDASNDFGIPNYGQLFRAWIDEDWGHKVSGLVLRYDPNVLLDMVFITHQNWLSYYRQLFHCPKSVECLGLDWKVEYTDANQGIMPESHNIWVQYTQSDLENTCQGQVPSSPVSYSSWTPLNQIIQFQERLPARKTESTLSKWCKKTQLWILRPQVQQYAVVIRTKYTDLHSWADCVDVFIWAVKQTDKMHIVPGGAIVGPAHLVRENVAWDRINSVWLVNHHADSDTHWTVY